MKRFQDIRHQLREVRKSDVVIVGLAVLILSTLYINFLREDDFKSAMGMTPKYDFSLEKIKNDELEKFKISLSTEQIIDRKVERDIFKGEDEISETKQPLRLKNFFKWLIPGNKK